jgi:hypothetical protein
VTKFVLGALSSVAMFGIYKFVRFLIDDANYYYERCRLDAIEEAEFRRTGRYDRETDQDVAERERQIKFQHREKR